jgi:hypothetical protein
MTRSVLAHPAKAKTLAQQQSDFTAEGSPPVGNVATAAPVTPTQGETKNTQPAKKTGSRPTLGLPVARAGKLPAGQR